jgi:adenine-specific DNA-methyltransferase
METMDTTGVKYIGSKASLIPYIIKSIEEEDPNVRSAIDVFTGTTRVAQALKKKGILTTTSDLSWASDMYANTWISNEGSNTHLQSYIDTLNMLDGQEGWLTKNYCDARGEGNSIIRVWQAKNGKKADSIRDTIAVWEGNGTLKPWEAKTLTTSLILALDKVDNTVGVQQAYLKDWCGRSFNDLHLTLPECIPGPQGKHIVGDCLTVQYPTADLAYLDPPYSTHSYSTYYHIWDSIAKWDKPDVSLKTNRRLDRVSGSDIFDAGMMSAWNSKKTALNAFDRLIERLPVKSVLVSYNNESLVPIEKLLELFKKYPSVKTTKIDYKRNIMCQIGNAAKEKTDEKEFQTKNTEYLFWIQKA